VRGGSRWRAERPFAHVADLRVARNSRAELLTLAELGALASIDPDASSRRAALWQVAALERDPRSLFAGASPPAAASPLPEMSALEETLADYRASGVSTGPHVMAHLRERLAQRGVLSATALRDVPNGRWVRTAGHVIVRQRPGSANGICFLTLEDDTGTANAVLTPEQFRRFRVPLHTSPLVEIEGPVQNVDGVLHVRVKRLAPLALAAADSPQPEPRCPPRTTTTRNQRRRDAQSSRPAHLAPPSGGSMSRVTAGAGASGRRGAAHIGLLGPLLCWAIVYADIGTSVYYVPGILFREVGSSAASFVLATSIVFVFLAEKYADISARYAGGGGVVSVATDAFGPRVGASAACDPGRLLPTAAISAVSVSYLATMFLAGTRRADPLGGRADPARVLNWVGIRESAAWRRDRRPRSPC
jgi:hypothetical protein